MRRAIASARSRESHPLARIPLCESVITSVMPGTFVATAGKAQLEASRQRNRQAFPTGCEYEAICGLHPGQDFRYESKEADPLVQVET